MVDYPREDIGRIRAEFSATTRRIREDARLTPQGRQIEMAGAYLQSKRQLDNMKKTFDSALKSERSTLERSVFGLDGTPDGAAMISWRDAQDRAATLTNQQSAQDLLTRAALSGDTALAKAVATRAVERGWGDVIRDYSEANPGVDEKIRQLANLPTGTSANMIKSAGFVLPKPDELGKLADEQLERLCATESEE